MADPARVRGVSRKAVFLRRTALLAVAGCATIIAILAATGPRITSLEINEVSAMVPMRTNGGGYWMVNDSGGLPMLYGVSRQGELVARVTVEGAVNRDWEAMASGPCAGWLATAPGGASPERCLFIGDTGTNGKPKAPVLILIVAEPDAGQTSTVALQSLKVQFPGLEHDAVGPDIEAIALDPATNTLLLFQKWRDGLPATPVFAASPDSMQGDIVRLKLAFSMPATSQTGEPAGPFTDAAITADGREMFVRDYRGLYRLLWPAGNRVEKPVLESLPARPVALGESMTVNVDGTTLTYSSEGWLPPLITIPLKSQ
jgi:hypothetical protein